MLSLRNWSLLLLWKNAVRSVCKVESLSCCGEYSRRNAGECGLSFHGSDLSCRGMKNWVFNPLFALNEGESGCPSPLRLLGQSGEERWGRAIILLGRKKK